MSTPYPNPAIPQGSLVLISGVNGYIASHIADQFLAVGYKVRGTVRDVSKAQWITELFDQKYGKGRFETVIVPDMGAPGAFNQAVKGCSAFLHTASALPAEKDPNKIIPMVKAGIRNAMEAAATEPAIKRFIYTSSSTAALNPVPNKEITVEEWTWNDECIRAAWKEPYDSEGHEWVIYSASKTEAEKAAWEFMNERKPNFVLNTVLPNANFGTILSEKQPASTAAWILGVFKGKLEDLKAIPPQYFVDVQDDAKIHVAATLNPDIKGERLFAFAEPYNWNRVLATLRKLFPSQSFSADIPNEGTDLSKIPSQKAENLLKDFGQTGWTPFETSIKHNVANLAAA